MNQYNWKKEDMTMKRTSQPKLYQGIILFVGGLIIFSIFMLTLILAFVTGEAFMLLTVGLLSLGLAAWLIIWGIMFLHNYRMSLIAKENGRPSTCVVLSKRITHSRIEVFFEITVRFCGQRSGLNYEHRFYTNEEFYTAINIGDKIKCLLDGDRCYVDPEFPQYVFDN